MPVIVKKSDRKERRGETGTCRSTTRRPEEEEKKRKKERERKRERKGRKKEREREKERVRVGLRSCVGRGLGYGAKRPVAGQPLDWLVNGQVWKREQSQIGALLGGQV